MSSLPSKASVAVIGGGIIGCSVAYHLAKAGLRDKVVLLEQGVVGCGTTWHAAGLVGQLRATETETKLSSMGARVLPAVAEETQQDVGFKRCGSLTLSRCDERTTQIRRNASRAAAFGVEAHILTPVEAKQRFPLLDETRFQAALWLPGDGSASPNDACNAFAKGARLHGAQLCEGVSVKECIVERRMGKAMVCGVRLDDGREIEADKVVVCAGMWSREFGLRNDVTIPLHPCEHFYVVTEPIDGVSSSLPVMRDPDAFAYYREWGSGLCLGAFEPNARPCFTAGIPSPFQHSLLPDDLDHFAPILERAMEAVPSLAVTPIRTMVNGPESFTPDNQYILGEVPEIEGYFVACGMNSSGIAASSGVGWATSHWVLHGRPPMDLWTVDVRRFGQIHRSTSLVRDRSAESLSVHYSIAFPRREPTTARNARLPPTYELLKEQGAAFGTKFGWERANFFCPPPLRLQDVLVANGPLETFSTPGYHKLVCAEHAHTRRQCSVFDVTSFAKFRIEGRGAEAFCNRVFAGNMLRPVGSVVYTPMLNDRGGYESDLTVARLTDSSYYVVSPTAHGTKDLAWLRRQAGDRDDVTISDVSDDFAVFSVQGPLAHQVLARSTNQNPKWWECKQSFPANTFQEHRIDGCRVVASRVSYVGEDGWELHVSKNDATTVYAALFRADTDVAVRPAGYYCIEAMRISRGYRAWGHELSSDDNPFEAGLAFALDFSKSGGFIGKEALVPLASRPRAQLTRRLVSVCTNDACHVMLWGGEGILRDGVSVGYLRSGAYLEPLGRCGGLGYVCNASGVSEDFLRTGLWQINVAGHLHGAQVSLKLLMENVK